MVRNYSPKQQIRVFHFDSVSSEFYLCGGHFSTIAREVSLRGRKRLWPNPLTFIYSVN